MNITKYLLGVKNLFVSNSKQATHVVSESTVISDNKIREEIIKGFLAQFTENQNHQQKIFIQFLSSVLIVIIAYVFVFTNTINPKGVKNNLNNTYKDLAHPNTTVIFANEQSFFQDTLIKPDLNSSLKLPNGNIYSYSIKHLIGIYLFCQFVFIVLISMIINMGYGFRRDLKIIHNIKCKFLGQKDYMELFGQEQYMGMNKKWYNFLPSFNLNLCFAILTLQILFWLSIYDFIKAGDKFFLNSRLLFFEGAIRFVKMKYLPFILGLPLAFSILIYRRYFRVYKKLKVTIVKQENTDLADS